MWEKPLFEYIQVIPQYLLNKYGMLATEPIDVCNTIIGLMTYTPDWKVHGKTEHWISNLNEMEQFLKDPRDDCDGAAIVIASWLHTIGNLNVRLCVGGYNSDAINHAWAGIVFENDIQILEAVGDTMINELPLLSNSPEYKLIYSASASMREVYTHV